MLVHLQIHYQKCVLLKLKIACADTYPITSLAAPWAYRRTNKYEINQKIEIRVRLRSFFYFFTSRAYIRAQAPGLTFGYRLVYKHFLTQKDIALTCANTVYKKRQDFIGGGLHVARISVGLYVKQTFEIVALNDCFVRLLSLRPCPDTTPGRGLVPMYIHYILSQPAASAFDVNPALRLLRSS